MNSATLENSPRLKRVLRVLKLRGKVGATTRDLVRLADVCAVNSVISELRANGIGVRCERVSASVYRYTLEEMP